MILNCLEERLNIPFGTSFLKIKEYLENKYKDKQILRFTASSFNKDFYEAHVLLLNQKASENDIFNFNKRNYEDEESFNACFMIPTGIGCEIGGHAGDGTPALNLIASICDKVVTHPNVVNASDINEMPNNALYIEGHHLTELLMGNIGLKKKRSNRVLVLIEGDENRQKFIDLAINSVNGARATLGLDADIRLIDSGFKMEAFTKNDKAVGNIVGLEKIINLIKEDGDAFDSFAIASPITLDEEVHKAYSKSDGEIVNPWGGVESMLTHTISSLFNKPSAHAPMIENESTFYSDFGVVDSRIASEIVSSTYLYCVLKGLHKTPQIVKSNEGLSSKDISVLIVPDGVLGLPILACLHQGIKVIAVKNKNTMQNDLSKLPWSRGQFFKCDNYLEASGVLSCLKAGVHIESVKRPLKTLFHI